MIKQIVPQEFCLKCLGCCRFSRADSIWSPSLLDEDLQVFLKNNIPPLLISSDNKIRLVYCEEQDNFICSLFDPEKNKCKTYALRPFECQLYPFLINRNATGIFLAADLKCPFIKENTDSPLFKEYVQHLTVLFNNPGLNKTLKNNPRIIQAYDEVINLVNLKI